MPILMRWQKLFQDLYGEDADDSPGAKYKKKWEEAEKKQNRIMLTMYNSGTSLEELQDLFGIENRRTLQNRLSKARTEG